MSAAGSNGTVGAVSGVAGTGSFRGDGRVGLGWSVSDSLVFLESIGPCLTFRLFFDGIFAGCIVFAARTEP